MALSETLRVTPRDLNGYFYAGKTLRKSDVVSIDPSIQKIVFRQPIDIKALNFSSTTELVLLFPSKVVHMMASGRLIAFADLFCGAIEAGSDIIIKGDLVTWIGDIESHNGNICVTGDVMSEGEVNALSGHIVVHGTIESAEPAKALGVWTKDGTAPVTDGIRTAAANAAHYLKKYKTT